MMTSTPRVRVARIEVDVRLLRRRVLAGACAVALLAVTAACSSTEAPPASSPTFSQAAPTPTVEAETAAAQGPTEQLQTEVIALVRETTGADSGNGPDPADPSHLVVEVYADRGDLSDADAGEMERQVSAILEEAGMTASFLYGGEVTGS